MCVLLSGELRVDHKRGTRVSMYWGVPRTCLGWEGRGEGESVPRGGGDIGRVHQKSAKSEFREVRSPRSQNSATYSSVTILPILFAMILDF